jgi:hypothetical protein
MSSGCADLLLCVRSLRSFPNHIRNAFRVAVFQLTHLFIFPLCFGKCCELIGQFLRAFFLVAWEHLAVLCDLVRLASGHCRKPLVAISDAAWLDGLSIVSASRLIAEC